MDKGNFEDFIMEDLCNKKCPKTKNEALTYYCQTLKIDGDLFESAFSALLEGKFIELRGRRDYFALGSKADLYKNQEQQRNEVAQTNKKIIISKEEEKKDKYWDRTYKFIGIVLAIFNILGIVYQIWVNQNEQAKINILQQQIEQINKHIR